MTIETDVLIEGIRGDRDNLLRLESAVSDCGSLAERQCGPLLHEMIDDATEMMDDPGSVGTDPKTITMLRAMRSLMADMAQRVEFLITAEDFAFTAWSEEVARTVDASELYDD